MYCSVRFIDFGTLFVIVNLIIFTNLKRSRYGTKEES